MPAPTTSKKRNTPAKMPASEQISRGLALPVMEAFHTLQGEGYHTGRAAWFIRTAGCDVGCTWCDVKASWDPKQHPVLPVDQLVEKATAQPAAFAVVTGGEPLIYDLTLLTRALRAKGMSTHLETSGAYPLSGTWDWICFSPKKFKQPLPSVAAQAHELKVVVYNRHDFKWAETHAAQVGPDCQLFLQPEWSRAEQVMPWITEYVRQNPRWRVSLQTHKYLGIP